MNIPVSQPYLNKQGRKYLLDAYDTNWISSKGGYIDKFEEAWAKYNGYAHGVACSSGTTALTLAIRGLGLKRGDAILVPEFTMVASAWSATYCGVEVVPIDCTTDLLMDVRQIPELLRKHPNIKAIMPVHIYGRQCDMKTIMDFAHDYNLFVIEDSAESHGIKPVGDIACYSLFGNKILTSGEGGICLTNDPRLAEQMKHLRAMAFDPEHTFFHRKIGYNYRMTNLQAAVALSQVEMIDEILKKREQIEKWYNVGLSALDCPYLIMMPPRKVLWMYDIRVTHSELRDGLRKFLKENGVDTRLFFKPISMQPMYYKDNHAMTEAYRRSTEGFYLPTYTQMTKKEVDYVVQKVGEYFKSLTKKDNG
jgi:dTDP-4-amino-4,6-dideoxygalactose transaminase|tara:strand:- start:8765 stop:9856 length:1092 start_codon:yes stop_codon:yes gene_type:complete